MATRHLSLLALPRRPFLIVAILAILAVIAFSTLKDDKLITAGYTVNAGLIRQNFFPRQSCLRIESSSEDFEETLGLQTDSEQAVIDKYLAGRCDRVRISRVLRFLHDLQAFPRITQEQVEGAWQNMCWDWSKEEELAGRKFTTDHCKSGVRVQIINNLVYFLPVPQNHSRLPNLDFRPSHNGTILDVNEWFALGQALHNDTFFYDLSWPRYAIHALTGLQEVLATFDIPDVDFIVEFGDQCAPAAFRTLPQRLAPVFSWSVLLEDSGESCSALAMPSYGVTWSSQNFSQGSLFRVDSYPPVPWDQKIPKLLWRGTFSGNPRLRARVLRMGLLRPDLFDIKQTGSLEECESKYPSVVASYGGAVSSKEPDCNLMTVKERMGTDQVIEFKFLLDVFGTGPTYRLRNLLLANSVVFRVQEAFRQWYYPDLKAYKHYIPISANDLERDLIRKVEWAINNDATVRKIGEDASRFAQEYIVDEKNVADFQMLGLSLYASRQAFKPSRHPKAHLMCCENLTSIHPHVEMANMRRRCRQRASTSVVCGSS